jgi:hypothetical protein
VPKGNGQTVLATSADGFIGSHLTLRGFEVMTMINGSDVVVSIANDQQSNSESFLRSKLSTD